MRKIYIGAIALLLLAGATFLAVTMIKNKKKPKPIAEKIVKTVFVDTVYNKSVPLTITVNGNLVAKEKIELYSEVQGVLERTSKEFKEGNHYAKNETLIQINDEEFNANLIAQKSNLLNSITSIMPDIRLDFPNEYNKWQKYITEFDITKHLNPLPSPSSEKEKFFISGRGITTTYYNVKNLEVKLDKHKLTAPFNGVLTEALVTPGTLIRQGQKLGEFINPSIYEIAVSVKSEYKNLLKVGEIVVVKNLEKTKFWNGKVVRINGKIDTSTQTIKAYVEVSSAELKEGQYVEVDIRAQDEENAFEIPRNILIENSKLFIVQDSVIKLKPINVVFENLNSVVVKGLENGEIIIDRPVPGAYDGMLVKIFNEK